MEQTFASSADPAPIRVPLTDVTLLKRVPFVMKDGVEFKNGPG